MERNVESVSVMTNRNYQFRKEMQKIKYVVRIIQI